MCAACSIISVLTQWGATLVIKIRERERERDPTKSAALDFGMRYFAENKSTGSEGRGLKFAMLVQLLRVRGAGGRAPSGRGLVS